MKLSEKIKALDFKGRDFPIIAGTVKFKLHNVHNGKDEVVEEHNMATNALADIFTNNYGGLINYQNFADLYNTWLGGVLLFQNQLDLTSADDYGIPDRITNPIKAHAGQTPLSDQADDLTRGNPDNTGTVLASGSTKLRWEWGTSAGNGTIAGLGLTHTDTGSYGAGVVSTTQRSLNPFANIGNTERTYSYGNSASAVLGIDGNTAYTFYYDSATHLYLYKTPINNTKFKLQGGSLLPLTAYTTTPPIDVTLTSCSRNSAGDCYYHFDFSHNNLILFRIVTEGQGNIYKDVISLSDGTVTHSSITIDDAKLWKFHLKGGLGQDHRYFDVPTRAMICNNYLYVYGYSGSDGRYANKMYRVNLSDTTNQDEVDTQDFSDFAGISSNAGYARVSERLAVVGDIIIHDSFLISGNKTFATALKNTGYTVNQNYAIPNSISSPVFGLNTSMNMISVCKLYLATKFNLPSAVTKTSAQSMTVEYTLTEV